MIELIMVLAVATIITAFAIPQVSSVIKYYRLRSAVSSATWAIQSVRFQALEEGLSVSSDLCRGLGGS